MASEMGGEGEGRLKLRMIAANAGTLQQPEPQTVAECLQAVQRYSPRQEEAARSAGQKPNFRAYEAQAKELARQYAARFELQKLSGSDLLTLALLYVEAGEYELARTATRRRLFPGAARGRRVIAD